MLSAFIVSIITLNFISNSDAFGQAVPIWSNPITGTNPGLTNPYITGDVKNANILVSGIGAVGIINQAVADRYNFDGWGTTTSLNTGKYFSFQITPASGYKISLSDFTYTGQREEGNGNNSGPVAFAIRSNANSDGYSTNIGTPVAGATTTISLVGASYQNLSNATQFRFYSWNGGSNGEFSINDFTFKGTVLGSATSALNSLDYFYSNGGPSTAQSFIVNGSGLTTANAVVTISGSTNYEVSTTSATAGFDVTANLISTAGTITDAKVWVRLKSGLAANSYNETITFGGGGVTGISIAVSGTVSKGGMVSANQTICTGSTPSELTLSAHTGTVIKWQKSTVADFSSAVTDIASTNTTLSAASIGDLNTTTYIRAVVQTALSMIANSSSALITVNPVTVEGTLSPAKTVGCVGTASGTITLSGSTGAVLRWELSTDAGNTWTSITNNTLTHNYSNLTKTTIYRAVIESGSCEGYSGVSIIVVDPPFTPSVISTPAITCIGQPVTLNATGYQSLGTLSGGGFDIANPEGWNGASANNNNAYPNSGWGETNGPKVFNGVTYNSTNKFMIVNGTTGLPGNTSFLSTPVFSTVGMTSADLSWTQAYNLNAGTVAKVEISLDGGGSYITLKTYTGPATLGPTDGLTDASIDLNAYLGRTNLKVRFLYTGSAGSNWAIDNIGMVGTYFPLNYTWSPAAGLSSTTGATVIFTPTSSGLFEYTVSTTTNSNCPGAGTGTIKITVNPSPTLGGVTIAPVCLGSDLSVNLTGLLASSTSTLTYRIGTAGTLVTVTGLVANSSGNASFSAPVVLANDGQTLTITSVSSKTSANDVSCSMIPTSNNSSPVSVTTGYVWTGEGIGNLWTTVANWNICGVPPDGSSVTIPDVSPRHFPKLNVDFFTSNNFDLLGNATIDLNGMTLELGTSTSSVLNLQGKIIGGKTSNLTIQGGSTSLNFDQSICGTTNSLLNFKVNSSEQTVILGNPLWIIGDVYPTAGFIVSDGNLTMVSTATSSSNITAFSLPSADVTGDVNVQSYITGGGAGLVHRGFRSMSSPIDDTKIILAGAKKTFRQMKDYIIVTGPGGITNGFDQGGSMQPFAETITLYNETAPAFSPSAPSITTIDQAQVPGTGFLAFFRGSQGGNGSANNIAKLNAPFVTPDPVTITYKGPINKFDIPVISLSYTDNLNDKYNGYNLVGNPYPSAINWNSVGRSANVINSFIIVLPGGKQASYMDGTCNNIPGNITNLSSTIIQPGQGFYVRASSAGATLSFTESSKSTLYPNRMLSVPRDVIMSTGPLAYGGSDRISSAARVIRLKLQDGTNSDETTLVFKDGGSMFAGFEDALYFSGGSVTLGSLSSDEKAMAINGLPDLSEVTEVRLNVNATSSRAVKLNFTDLSQAKGYEVFLKDTLSPGKLVDVKANPVYDFTIDKSRPETYGNERLTILFKKEEIFPLELTPFTAKKQTDGVELSWILLATGIAREYEIEQSADGKTFHKIGSIRSQGNTSGNEKYYFTDKDPVLGINYYRVRQIHSNGRASLSEIRSINNSLLNEIGQMNVYPNPASDKIELNHTDVFDEAVALRIYDMHSRILATKNFSPGERWRYNVSKLVPSIYIIEVRLKRDNKLIGRSKFVKGL